MSDWAAVVLVLGLCGIACAVYGIRALAGVRSAALDLNTLRASSELQVRNVEGIDGRLKRVESMLKLDGARIQAEASRAALPMIMR